MDMTESVGARRTLISLFKSRDRSTLIGHNLRRQEFLKTTVKRRVEVNNKHASIILTFDLQYKTYEWGHQVSTLSDFMSRNKIK